MENPEIPWRIQMERFIPVEITFFPFLPKRPKFSVPFVWITSARLHVERERKIYRHFVNGITQSRSCFRFPKKYSTIWRKFFTEISVQMVSTQGHRQPRFHPCLKWPIAIEIHPSGKLCLRDRKYSVTDGGKYFLCTVSPRSCPPPCWRQRGRDGLSIRWPDVSHILTTRKICSR